MNFVNIIVISLILFALILIAISLALIIMSKEEQKSVEKAILVFVLPVVNLIISIIVGVVKFYNCIKKDYNTFVSWSTIQKLKKDKKVNQSRIDKLDNYFGEYRKYMQKYGAKEAQKEFF